MRNARQFGAATAGGLLLAGIVGGVVVGLSMTNGGASETGDGDTTRRSVLVAPTDQPSSTSLTIEAPPAPTISMETATPTVESVTPTPEPAPAETTTEAYVPPAPAPANPAPQVTQGEGIIEGPSAEPGATVAPPPPVGVAPTGEVNSN